MLISPLVTRPRIALLGVSTAPPLNIGPFKVGQTDSLIEAFFFMGDDVHAGAGGRTDIAGGHGSPLVCAYLGAVGGT